MWTPAVSRTWVGKTARRVHVKHVLLAGTLLYVLGLLCFVLPRSDRRTAAVEDDDDDDEASGPVDRDRHRHRELQRRLARVARALTRNLTVLARLETALLAGGGVVDDGVDELMSPRAKGGGWRGEEGSGAKVKDAAKPHPWDDPESPGESPQPPLPPLSPTPPTHPIPARRALVWYGRPFSECQGVRMLWLG